MIVEDDDTRQEDVSPTPNEDNQDDQTAPKPDDQTDDNQPEIDETDVDAVEMRDAQAALQAEKEEAEQTAEPTAEPDAQASQGEEPPAQATDENQDKGKVEMIPKPRFDEVNSKLNDYANRNAYLEGILVATQTATQGAQPGQEQPAGAGVTQQPQQASDPDTRLNEIDNELVAISRQFDEGEISAVEMQEKQILLRNERDDIREQRTLAKVTPSQPTPQISLADQQVLDAANARLAEAHPFADLVDDAQFEEIKEVARMRLGPDWQAMPASPAKTLQLREMVGQVSDQLGPGLTGLTMEQAKAKLNGNQPQQPSQQQPAPSAQAKARQAKLDQAGNMPPDVSSMPDSSDGTGSVTMASIEAMSDDEIAALPQATRDRLMGLSG